MADAFRIQITGSRLYGAPDIIGNALSRLHADHAGERIVLVHGKCDPRGITGKHWPIPWAAAEQMPADKQLALLGGDWLADRLARKLGWGVEMFPANWKAPCPEECKPGHRRKRHDGDYCPMAGHYRNSRMAAIPSRMCLALFAGGQQNRGTLDCAGKTLAAGTETWCLCDQCEYPKPHPCRNHSLAAVLRAWEKVKPG